jgi:hypothetical protein
MGKFNEHQKRILTDMVKELNRAISSETEYRSLVNRLEGLLQAGEFKDESFVQQWYKLWKPLEIYNADRIDTGKEIDIGDINKEIQTLRNFLLDQLKS